MQRNKNSFRYRWLISFQLLFRKQKCRITAMLGYMLHSSISYFHECSTNILIFFLFFFSHVFCPFVFCIYSYKTFIRMHSSIHQSVFQLVWKLWKQIDTITAFIRHDKMDLHCMLAEISLKFVNYPHGVDSTNAIRIDLFFIYFKTKIRFSIGIQFVAIDKSV